jgi:hypothetical protein
MRSNLIRVAALFSVMMLAACQTQQDVSVLPTLAVLPSLTPSNTPTNTPLASPTPTHTSTSTATNTATATTTISSTPTRTPTITNTPLPTATSTNTLTHTPLPTNTPLATNTPTLTNTPAGPQILSFTASATNVTANTSIVLTWNTIADSARIDQLNAQGAVVTSFAVVPSGSLPLSVPGNTGTLVVYRLVAQRGGQETNFSVAITVQCVTAWFFGNQFAPSGSGCPTGPQTNGVGSFQQFERGFMIYAAANNLNTVYGAQNQDARYISYLNGWDGSTVYTCFGTPSIAPQGIFGWTYCNTNAPIGGWSAAVGNAIGNADNSNRTVQFEDTGAVYIDSPIGVFRFSGAPGLTWRKIT